MRRPEKQTARAALRGQNIHKLRGIEEPRHRLGVGKAAAYDEPRIGHPAGQPRQKTLPGGIEPPAEETDLPAVGVAAEDQIDVPPRKPARVILRVVAQQNVIAGAFASSGSRPE